MNIPPNKSTWHRVRKAPISIDMHLILGALRRLSGFFRMTKADLLTAGIDMGDEGYDDESFELYEIAGQTGLTASVGVSPSNENGMIL